MPLLLFILVSVCLLLLVSGAYIFVIACGKRQDVDWLDEKAVSQTQNAQYYPYMVASSQWLKENGAVDIYTKSTDGVQLHALWIPVENS